MSQLLAGPPPETWTTTGGRICSAEAPAVWDSAGVTHAQGFGALLRSRHRIGAQQGEKLVLADQKKRM